MQIEVERLKLGQVTRDIIDPEHFLWLRIVFDDGHVITLNVKDGALVATALDGRLTIDPVVANEIRVRSVSR
jgi:hypothetical protein